MRWSQWKKIVFFILFYWIDIIARNASEEFSSGSDTRSKDADEYPSPKDKDKDEGINILFNLIFIN